MKVVKILWEDSCNSNLNWVTKEDVEVELVNIDSFGVVVKETDEFVSIAQNYGSEPEQFSNIVTIPRGCIKEIFVIHDDSQLNEKQKPADNEMIEILRTEYEKGRADAIAEMQKPWSEEDEQAIEDAETWLDTLCDYLKDNSSECIPVIKELISKLKSLKDRVLPQPKQEWSEEDEERIEQICSDLKCGMINFYANKVVKGLHYKEIIESNIDWLKSLRPQKQWKPTEDNIDQAISILEKAAKDIKIPEKYKTSDWLCEKEDDLIENLHRQLRDNILRAKEEAKNKI